MKEWLDRNRKAIWRLAAIVLVLVWCASIGLFTAGVLFYPWGLILLPVLAGWAWYMMRQCK